MAGLLDFLLGGGLLGQSYGGPSYPNGGGQTQPQNNDSGVSAMAQTMPQQQQMPTYPDNLLTAMFPAAANTVYQRQAMQFAMKSLMAPKEQGGSGMNFPQAMVTLQNPKVQEQLFGVQSLGAYKTPGGYEGQIVNQGGRVSPVFPSANGQPPADLGVRAVKPMESLIDVSGGSASPVGRQGTPLYQNTQGMLDPQTVDFYAKQLLAGDTSVLQNLGRMEAGAMNIAAVRNRAAQLANMNGISPEEAASRTAEYGGYKSSQTTLGNRLGQVSLAINEAKQLIPQALEASNNVTRVLGGKYMPVNKIVNAYQENTGDPNIIKLGAALYGLAHTYARAINPTGVIADADVERAYHILDAGLSKGQLASGISQVYQEMQAVGKSPGAVKQEFREQFTGTAGLAGKQQSKSLGDDPLGMRSNTSANDPLGLH